MAAMDTWEAGADVWDLVQHHISHNHSSLALVDKEIAVIFRGKASKTGGQVVLGKSRKAGAIFKLLGKSDYKFILELAGDEWATLSNEQRSALIDHLLCACKVEEDEKTHELKYSIAAPEVSFFWDELKRHGDWRTRVQQEVAGAMNVESALDLMSKADEDVGDAEDTPQEEAPAPVAKATKAPRKTAK